MPGSPSSRPWERQYSRKRPWTQWSVSRKHWPLAGTGRSIVNIALASRVAPSRGSAGRRSALIVTCAPSGSSEQRQRDREGAVGARPRLAELRSLGRRRRCPARRQVDRLTGGEALAPDGDLAA